MNISETKFNFLKDDCIKLFGNEVGAEVYKNTDELYIKLCEENDSQNNDAIKTHMTENMFPPMAYYLTLRENNIEKDAALDYVRKETQKTAEAKRGANAKMASLPCAYLLYRMFVKKVMKKNFPVEGWETEWVQLDGKQIAFNMKRCIYKGMCEKYSCPELCTVYCENDDIAFAGLMPKIKFERTETLGQGGQCCDFRFIKNE